ncbi:MAG: pyridoxamine 5'-phosphate oxidase family protein [Thermoplasmatota archaeon]
MDEGNPIKVEDILELIEDQKAVYVATIDGDIPRVRPLTLVRFDSRYFILTGMNDAKIRQIKDNNSVEICCPLKGEIGNGYIRMDGIVDIVGDMKLKKKVADHVSYFKEYWDTPEDPTYALLEFRMRNMEYMKPGDNYSSKYRDLG